MTESCAACRGQGQWRALWTRRMRGGGVAGTSYLTKQCVLCGGSGVVDSDAPALQAVIVGSDRRGYRVTVTAPDGRMVRSCTSSSRAYALQDAGVCNNLAQLAFAGYAGHRLVITERPAERYSAQRKTRSFGPGLVGR